jgi:hypothetical protein
MEPPVSPLTPPTSFTTTKTTATAKISKRQHHKQQQHGGSGTTHNNTKIRGSTSLKDSQKPKRDSKSRTEIRCTTRRSSSNIPNTTA